MLCARESCVQRRVDLRRITIIIFYIYNFIIIIKLHGVILLLLFFFLPRNGFFFFFYPLQPGGMCICRTHLCGWI